MRTIGEIRAEAEQLTSWHLTDADISWLAEHGHDAAEHIVRERERGAAYQKWHGEAEKERTRLDALGIEYDVVMEAGTGYMIAVVPRDRRYIAETGATE